MEKLSTKTGSLTENQKKSYVTNHVYLKTMGLRKGIYLKKSGKQSTKNLFETYKNADFESLREREEQDLRDREYVGAFYPIPKRFNEEKLNRHFKYIAKKIEAYMQQVEGKSGSFSEEVNSADTMF
jgi:hypothetical protein